MQTLFHKEVYMPKAVSTLARMTIIPRITRHAEEQAAQDRYGVINIPSSVTFSGANVIEAEMVQGSVRKLVVRLSYDATRDIVMAIAFERGESAIKTVWFNEKNDRHMTLDKSKYAKGVK